MPPDVNVHDLERRSRSSREQRAERQPRDRHLAHVEARDHTGRGAQRPGHDLGWVELRDGRWEDMPDPVDETINHRELPGEGEFPIREYVDAVRDAGYAEPWGVEVLSEKLRALPIEEIFDRGVLDESAQLVTVKPRSTTHGAR